MKTKNKIMLAIVVVLMGIFFTLIGVNKLGENPLRVYQVYLDGKKVGLVEDKDELLNLINEEQQEIKDTYQINQVYPPTGFDILESITYNGGVSSANDIYQKIKNQGDFTIEGYEIIITSPATKDKDEKVTKIYVLDDKVFTDAEYSFITTFVDEKDYQAYINNTQSEITTVGSYIKHMEFEENITIKKTYISVKNKIFTDAKELTQYLLYGTTDSQENYIVKQGDTLESIASASKLNVRELMIANPKYRNANAVLAIGDKISNRIINPILTLYEEMRLTEDVEQAYTKTTVTDNTLKSGESKVTQAGVTGLERVTQELRVINGERSQETTLINSVTIRNAVEEVTSVGPKYSPTYGWTGSGGTGGTINTGLSWSWPTKTPYIITTDYEYRWGSFHNAIDISGTGFNSPVYASRAGTVVEIYNSCANYGWYGSMCGGSYGNYVVIEHDNNYYTMYAHLTSNLEVSVGSRVSQGQVIGHMGSSGSSTGTHLHFGLSVGMPNHGGKWYSPWSLFR